MQVIPVTAVHRGFGTDLPSRSWWAAPLAVFLGLSAFVVYATWAAFQGEHYVRSVPVAVLLAGALGRFAARLVRPEARLVAGVHCRFRRRC